MCQSFFFTILQGLKSRLYGVDFRSLNFSVYEGDVEGVGFREGVDGSVDVGVICKLPLDGSLI